MQVVVSVGFSNFFDCITHVRPAFKESREALKHRLKKGQGLLIFQEQVLNDYKDAQVYHYPVKLVGSLLDHLKNNTLEINNTLINNIFSEIYLKNNTLVTFQLSILRLINDLYQLMNFLKIDAFEINIKRDFYTTISEFKKPDEIEIYIKDEFIDIIINTVDERKKNDYQSLPDSIINIIENEFETDLTLEVIANRLHYHPNYLSTIFKKTFNMSFTEYLNEQRHSQAKTWLLESNSTIKDISERLHYTNPQNFIRSFRKLEGVTPGQYRQLNR